MANPHYTVPAVPDVFDLQRQWDSSLWRLAPALHINAFRPESKNHRPLTEAKLLYSPVGLHGFFRVRDRFVRCIHTGFQEPVYQDSCVEFFVKPRAGKGYFNFEFNCGGAMLASYIVDPARVEGGFKDFTRLTPAQGSRVSIYHSLPPVVEPEITEEITWFIEFAIPFSLLEEYAGPLGRVAGQTWAANFHKCGDNTSQPHWAAWAAVDELNFHLPRCFGRILLAS